MTLPAGDSLFEIDGVFVEPLTESIAVEGEFQVGSGFDIGLARFSVSGVSLGPVALAGATIDPDNGSGSAMDANGNIVVAFAEMYPNDNYNDGLGVVRFQESGAIDLGFGSGGTWLATQYLPYVQSGGNAVAIQGDGAIVVGGWASNSVEDSPALVVRLTPSGVLDTSFNGCGYVLGPDFSTATALVIQPDGKIIAGLQFWSQVRHVQLNAIERRRDAGHYFRRRRDRLRNLLRLHRQSPAGYLLGLHGPSG